MIGIFRSLATHNSPLATITVAGGRANVSGHGSEVLRRVGRLLEFPRIFLLKVQMFGKVRCHHRFFIPVDSPQPGMTESVVLMSHDGSCSRT